MQWLDGTTCGVDEAGRGPLVGAVVAAAVILDPQRRIEGLRDSKKLSAATRERLAIEIRENAVAWAIGEASADEIDQLNILQASLLAMRRAVESLNPQALRALIDGNRCPDLAIPAEAIVKGDDKIAAIAAASILAKTYRDAQMQVLHQQHPQFGFDRHMGYPTPVHLEALKVHGPIAEHRASFGPVRRALMARGQVAQDGQADF